MVISLGQLTLKTEPKSGQQNVAGMHTSGLTNEDIMREMLEQAYDKFALDIQNIQVSWTLIINISIHLNLLIIFSKRIYYDLVKMLWYDVVVETMVRMENWQISEIIMR